METQMRRFGPLALVVLLVVPGCIGTGSEGAPTRPSAPTNNTSFEPHRFDVKVGDYNGPIALRFEFSAEDPTPCHVDASAQGLLDGQGLAYYHSVGAIPVSVIRFDNPSLHAGSTKASTNDVTEQPAWGSYNVTTPFNITGTTNLSIIATNLSLEGPSPPEGWDTGLAPTETLNVSVECRNTFTTKVWGSVTNVYTFTEASFSEGAGINADPTPEAQAMNRWSQEVLGLWTETLISSYTDDDLPAGVDRPTFATGNLTLTTPSGEYGREFWPDPVSNLRVWSPPGTHTIELLRASTGGHNIYGYSVGFLPTGSSPAHVNQWLNNATTPAQ